MEQYINLTQVVTLESYNESLHKELTLIKKGINLKDFCNNIIRKFKPYYISNHDYYYSRIYNLEEYYKEHHCIIRNGVVYNKCYLRMRLSNGNTVTTYFDNIEERDTFFEQAFNDNPKLVKLWEQ